MGFAALGLQLALLTAGDPTAAAMPFELITVDVDGHPVGDVPVEWSFGGWSVARDVLTNDAITDPVTGIAVIDDARFAKFAAMGNSSNSARVFDGLRFAACVPCATNAPGRIGADVKTRVRLVVEPIRFVECVVTDSRGRSVIEAEDVVLDFDDGSALASMNAGRFARRDDHVRVPLPRAKFASMRMRASRGATASAWVDVATCIAQLDQIRLQLSSDVTFIGRLLTPAGEPLRDESIAAVPSLTTPPSTCLMSDDHDRTRAFATRTQADGAFVLTGPLRATRGELPTTLRLEVHRPLGRCWLADVQLYPRLDAATVDLGVIEMIADQRVVCGRVVDDRDHPIAHVKLATIVGRRSVAGAELASTDEHGRFRFAIAMATAFMCSKVGFTSPPVRTVEPGADDIEVRLVRCATLNVTCLPSATLLPEHFEVRWSNAESNGSAMLHAWRYSIDSMPAGKWTIELVLRDDARAPIASQGVTIEPGSANGLKCDLSSCGLVTLRLRTPDGAEAIGASAAIAGTARVVGPPSMSTLRIAIAAKTVVLSISAPGYATVNGAYAHGEHTVVLSPLR